jgi:hypothetical protein
MPADFIRASQLLVGSVSGAQNLENINEKQNKVQGVKENPSRKSIATKTPRHKERVYFPPPLLRVSVVGLSV